MLAMKWLLMAARVAMFGTAAGVVAHDVYLAMQFQKLMHLGEHGAAEKAGASRPIRWTLAAQRFAWARGPLLPAPNVSMLAEGSTGACPI
jgi:hypothetical protein